MAPTSSAFIVDVDGSPLAADAKAMLVSAYVDDSLRLPDTFVLRFRDSERMVIAKSGAKIGGKVKVSVASVSTCRLWPPLNADASDVALALKFSVLPTIAASDAGYASNHVGIPAGKPESNVPRNCGGALKSNANAVPVSS